MLLQLIQDLQLLDEILPKQAEEKGTNKQVQKKQEEKSIAELLAEEQATTINSLYQNPNLLQSFIYQDDDNDDDDYDKESILSMNMNIFETPSPDAIMTSSPIEEPKDSLIIEDEDINTIPIFLKRNRTKKMSLVLRTFSISQVTPRLLPIMK
ncbi:hypothetical protein Tco_1101426 [Tanacetum coccineum]